MYNLIAYIMQTTVFFLGNYPLYRLLVQVEIQTDMPSLIFDMRHGKTDLKVFIVVIPKEGWPRVAAPILLFV